MNNKLQNYVSSQQSTVTIYLILFYIILSYIISIFFLLTVTWNRFVETRYRIMFEFLLYYLIQFEFYFFLSYRSETCGGFLLDNFFYTFFPVFVDVKKKIMNCWQNKGVVIR